MRIHLHRWRCALAVLAASFLVAPAAAAPIYTFVPITNNNGGLSTTLAPQLSVELLDPGAGQVQFKFVNANGPVTSVIAEIYWDDNAGVLGSLTGLPFSGGGVDWQAGATPPQLPSENTAVPPFTTDAAFNSSATNPAPTNGINTGEFLTLTFNLAGGKSVADVQNALDSGTLRTGMHVISINGGGSDSFVNGGSGGNGGNGGGGGGEIPEPTSIVLFGAMMSAAGYRWMRRRKTA